MWRNISRREYHYICRIEKEGMKHKIIYSLTWVILALLIILSGTYLNQLSEQERMTDQYMTEGLLSFFHALGSGGKEEGDFDASSAVVVHAREKRALSYTYVFIYIGECIGVAAIYFCYCRGVYLRKRRFLKSHLYAQDGVCVGKKEVYGRFGSWVTVNLVTNEGRRLSDVSISSPVDREIECDTKVILVTDWIEENGNDLDWKEFINAGYEREFRVYPAQANESSGSTGGNNRNKAPESPQQPPVYKLTHDK